MGERHPAQPTKECHDLEMVNWLAILEKDNNIYLLSCRWPQTDILAHENTKLFITHGGYNSILEAQYFGVPLLGIPIYGDQMTNLDVVVHEKWAQVLHLYNFTVPVVTGTIHQMLNNPRY